MYCFFVLQFFSRNVRTYKIDQVFIYYVETHADNP
jgi:hypothetical protein